MKRKLVGVLAFAVCLVVGNLAVAQTPPDVSVGTALAVYADPDDFVVHLDVAGPRRCGGSFFYHVERRNRNFRELTAVILTAFSTGKQLGLFLDGGRCASLGSQPRNLVTHGFVAR